MEIRQNTLSELEPHWRKLSDAGSVSTPYQSYEWQSAWWRHFGKKGSLWLLSAWEKETLLGIAPLMIVKMSVKGLPLFRVVNFIGTGVSDYLDFIIVKDKETVVISVFLQYLIAHKRQWDLLWLSEIPDDSLTHDILRNEIKNLSLACRSEQHSVCPYIALPKTYQEYVSSLNFHTRKKVKNLRNRLVKTGNLEYISLERNSPEAIQSTIKEFFSLHNERWRREGERGHVRSQEIMDFHAEAATALSEHIHFSTLKLFGKTIASMYCYDWKEIRYFYWIGWDPDFAEHSPGFVLITYSIENAIAKRMKGFDFLRGNENYKSHFTKETRTSSRYFISHSKLKLFLFNLIEKISRKP